MRRGICQKCEVWDGSFWGTGVGGEIETDFAMGVVVGHFVGFEVGHAGVAFLAEVAFCFCNGHVVSASKICWLESGVGCVACCVQKKVLRASRALSVVASGRVWLRCLGVVLGFDRFEGMREGTLLGPF